MVLRRKGETGLSLVELLVVLGIIATISAVAIPVLARSGLFTSNKSQLAARELFTVLRAAKIYATTHNVETAVAYGGLLVLDSREDVEFVPVVDSVALVRRMKRDELLLHGYAANHVFFVPLRARDGGFKALPNGTCILPDLFAADLGKKYSLTGLTAALILDIDERVLLEPRLDYNLYNREVDPFTNLFPAHRFSPEGTLLASPSLQLQRVKFRVGILPDAESGDRFFQEPILEVGEEVPIFFNEEGEFLIPTDQPADPETIKTPIDIDVDIFLFVPTGRVKVGS